MRTVKVSTFTDTTESGVVVKDLIEWYGTSLETKPTVNIAMGSWAFEVDTGKVFSFNETTGEWVEETSLQS